MKKSYAKQFKKGPIFGLRPGLIRGWYTLRVFGEKYPEDGEFVAMVQNRKYATMLIKAMTLKAREKKKK